MTKLARARRHLGIAGVSPLKTLNEIIELRNKGVLTQSEFEALARVMASQHIGAEASERFGSVLTHIEESFRALIVKNLMFNEHERTAR